MQCEEVEGGEQSHQRLVQPTAGQLGAVGGGVRELLEDVCKSRRDVKISKKNNEFKVPDITPTLKIKHTILFAVKTILQM